MYSHQVYISIGDFALKIRLVLGQSWMIMYKCISPRFVECAVVYMQCALFTNSYVQKSLSYCEVCCCVHEYFNILGHQSQCVYEFSDSYPLYCLSYLHSLTHWG